MADSSQEGSSQSRNPSPARDCSSDGESDGATKPAARASSGTRCTGPSCSRWAMTLKADEPWTHHRLCGTHLVCTPSGAVCAVCRDWSAEIWKAFKVKDLQLQKKRDYRENPFQSPAKAREPVPPGPSPIVLDSPDPSEAEAPHKKKRDVRRTPRPSRTHKKKKRKYSSPSSYESSSSGSSPGTSPDRGRRHRSPSPRYHHHSLHRSRKSRSGERRPTASVSATPARTSGSGLPADGAALEQLLHQTLTRFTAAHCTTSISLSRPGTSCGNGTRAGRSSPASEGAHPGGRAGCHAFACSPAGSTPERHPDAHRSSSWDLTEIPRSVCPTTGNRRRGGALGAFGA